MIQAIGNIVYERTSQGKSPYTKHKSREAGEGIRGIGGIGGRSEEGSEGSGRAEIVRIKGKREEKGDIIAIGHLQKQETAKKYQTFLNEILTVSVIKRNGMIAVKKKLCAQAAIHH